MRWVREVWIEVVLVALLVSAGSATLGVLPRLGQEAVSLAVLFLSHLAVLGAATFLILRSNVAGWWVAGFALLAVAGPRLLADRIERVLLGGSLAGAAYTLVVDGGLTAAGLVVIVGLVRGWRRSPLRLTRTQLASVVPAGSLLAIAYAVAYALAVWALSAAGLAYRGAGAGGLSLGLAGGLARGAVMVACATPLLLTLLGRRVKNGLGVGALLGLGTLAAHLAAARSLSGDVLAGAAVQGLLGFLLGGALVRFTYPPLVKGETSRE